MKLLPANLGPERKKALWLIGLVVVIPIAYFLSSSSSDSSGPQAASTPATQPTAAIPALPTLRKEAPTSVPTQRNGRGGARPTEDFRPSLKPKEGVDISAIDPTLHLDRLAKLHNLAMEGGARSVFKEGSAPVPPPPPVILPVGPIKTTTAQTPDTPTTPPGPPPTPPPPPIPLKYYGYATPARGGAKKAFFLEGEDIHIAGENDLIRNRYKIIRIGVNSAVVEDTKDNHQQTLPLVEEFAG